jgi:hypothetical protein
MTNRSKNIGTAAESAVVRACKVNGFPDAERRALAGSMDKGDVLVCPGVIIEVKAGEAAIRASDSLVDKWLAETDAEIVNAEAQIGFLVMKRKGIGPDRADEWWAVMRTHTFAHLCGGLPLGLLDGLIPIRMRLGNALSLLQAAGYDNQNGAFTRG